MATEPVRGGGVDTAIRYSIHVGVRLVVEALRWHAQQGGCLAIKGQDLRGFDSFAPGASRVHAGALDGEGRSEQR